MRFPQLRQGYRNYPGACQFIPAGAAEEPRRNARDSRRREQAARLGGGNHVAGLVLAEPEAGGGDAVRRFFQGAAGLAGERHLRQGHQQAAIG